MVVYRPIKAYDGVEWVTVGDPRVKSLVQTVDTGRLSEASLSGTFATKDELAGIDVDGGGTSQRVSQVLADTRAEDSRVAVERVDATKYLLYQALGGGRWWRSALQRGDTMATVPPGGGQVHQLYLSDVVYPMVGVGEDAASVTATGTWSSGSNAGTYGGTYVRSNVAGDAVEFTTPGDTVAVALHYVEVLNAGVARVSIDGDPTLANRLPTAQELVDAGTLPSTVLTAGGGTLAPTDRVLDQYNSGTIWGASNMLAEDLPPGEHTVRLEVTGYKRAASSDTRAYVSGFAYTTRTMTPATPGTEPVTSTVVVPRDSAWEYAHSIRPTGGSNYTFVGNVHGYEYQDALAFTVDGAATALTDGQVVVGRKVEVSRGTRLRHPNTGTTNVATVTTTYTLTGNGLRVQHTTDWLVGGNVSAAYPAMFPVNKDNFKAGMIDTLATDIALGADDGQFLGGVEGNLIGAWEPYGQMAAVLYMPDVQEAVNGWLNSAPLYMSIEDRVRDGLGVSLSKFYVARGTNLSPTTYTASDVWTSDALYRVAWVARGGDAALSNTV